MNFFIFTAEPGYFMTFSTMIQNNRRVLQYCIRIVFTGGLFTLALLKVDIVALLSAFNHLTVTLPLFIAGFVGIIISQILFAWRTHRLLSINNMPSFVTNIFFVNICSNFYNLIFPSTIAGGAVRWYRFGKPGGEKLQSLSIILFERIFDNICWLLLLTVSVIYLCHSSMLDYGYVVIVSSLLLVFLSTLSLIAYQANKSKTRSTEQPPTFLNSIVKKCIDCAAMYTHNKRELSFIFLLSIVFNLLFQLCIFCMLTSIGGTLRFDVYCASSMIIYITSQFPVTISGIGLNEFVFLTFFRLVGINPVNGIVFGLLGSINNIFWALLGGVVELFSRGQYIRETRR